jgi:hypothetical protein
VLQQRILDKKKNRKFPKALWWGAGRRRPWQFGGVGAFEDDDFCDDPLPSSNEDQDKKADEGPTPSGVEEEQGRAAATNPSNQH